jgi:hypothetical protein
MDFEEQDGSGFDEGAQGKLMSILYIKSSRLALKNDPTPQSIWC